MKNPIVEKKFITKRQPQQTQLKNYRHIRDKLSELPSFTSTYSGQGNVQTFQSVLRDSSRHEQILTARIQHFYKQSTTSQLLSYSQTATLPSHEEIMPLVNKIVNLMACKEYIYDHVFNSLGVKGYKSQVAKEIAKIIANSFSQYTSIAQTLIHNLKRQEQPEKEDEVIRLNRLISTLKTENAQQFQSLTQLQEQHHRLKKNYNELKKTQTSNKSLSNQNKQNDTFRSFVEKQMKNMSTKMEQLESQVYKKMTVYQDQIIQLSHFRNNLMMQDRCITAQRCRRVENREQRLCTQFSQSNLLGQKEHSQEQNNYDMLLSRYKAINQQKQHQIDRLSALIVQMTQQLDLQKKLYDQMLQKNISFQKQLYFLNKSRQSINSLNIQQQTYNHYSINSQQGRP